MSHARFRLILLTLAVALALPSLMLITSPAHAQASIATAIPISLPAQSLGTALNELARQARLQLMVHPDLVADKQAPAVSGSLTPRQALDRVLAGSGLKADIQGTEVIIRKMPDTVGSGSVTLPPMTVTGTAINPGATEGTGSYTTSQSSYGKGQMLKDLPQTVTVMTRQRIDDQKLKTLDDVLVYTPGITVQQNNTANSVFYSRGFAITNFQIDGNSPLYGGESGHAGGPNTSQLDLAMFDHVEVLRGSDALYGTSGEPGGAINLVRKKPTSQFQVKALAHAGSWNNYRGELDVGGSIMAGRIRGRLVGVYEDRKYFYDYGKSDKQLLYGIIEADITDSTMFTVGGDVMRQDFGAYSPYGLPRYSNGADIGLPRSYYLGTPDDRWLRKNNKQFVRIDQTIGTDWTLGIEASRAESRNFRNDMNWWGAIDPITFTGLYGREREYSIMAKHNKHLTPC